MDLSGPFIKGLPVTDRREKEELWPRYMVVGAFMPFTLKEAQDRYDQERRDRIAAGLEGQDLDRLTQNNDRLARIWVWEDGIWIFWPQIMIVWS